MGGQTPSYSCMLGISALCVGLRQLVPLLPQRMLPLLQLGPRLPARQLLPLQGLKPSMRLQVCARLLQTTGPCSCVVHGLRLQAHSSVHC